MRASARDGGERGDVKVSLRSLYKIFGDDPAGVLDHARAGMSKAELLAEHQHVLGLRDINVDMRAGEITVIMGLSGSGKSTLIRHLNRLIEPTAGRILVDGDDVMAYGTEELRALRQTRMSMVFQKFALLPHRTIAENAGMALAIRGASRTEAAAGGARWLDRVGLEGYGDYLPAQLSGGMQQRVGLARALASDAEIMLMDEAFSALDPLIRSDMQNLLVELQSELRKTIVFITHDLDESLKLADHLVVLKDGEIVQQGEPQSIIMQPADDYVAEFVGDINRARVLRVGSVMTPMDGPTNGAAGEIDCNATLEQMIALTGGDTSQNYVVTRDGDPVGELDMKDLVRALAPDAGDTTPP